MWSKNVAEIGFVGCPEFYVCERFSTMTSFSCIMEPIFRNKYVIGQCQNEVDVRARVQALDEPDSLIAALCRSMVGLDMTFPTYKFGKSESFPLQKKICVLI